MIAHPVDRRLSLPPRVQSRTPRSISRIKCRTSATMRAFAHRSSRDMMGLRSLRAASVPNTAKAGASNFVGGGVQAQPEGFFVFALHAFTFAPVHLVIQPVIPNFFSITPVERRRAVRSEHFIEAPMDQQLQLPLLCRLDAPSVVPPALIVRCKNYRDAVRLCWELRRVRNMTRRRLAEEAGLYAPHVSCYLNDNQRSRDLPGACVRAFEWACGNTAISQWHALNAKLTCLEEMQAMRASA